MKSCFSSPGIFVVFSSTEYELIDKDVAIRLQYVFVFFICISYGFLWQGKHFDYAILQNLTLLINIYILPNVSYLYIYISERKQQVEKTNIYAL